MGANLARVDPLFFRHDYVIAPDLDNKSLPDYFIFQVYVRGMMSP
jgi:hypothetical protein